jgi:hypothetical protein
MSENEENDIYVKINYKGVNYKILLPFPKTSETTLAWIIRVQERCHCVLNLPPSR